MSFFDTTWYCNYGDGSTTGYYAVTKWATGATIAAGALRRQNATPTINNERVFVCIVAGTTHATTEPTWTITRGGKTTDNTVTWQECTGASAVNGDLTNTPNWTAVKNVAVTLGQIIKRNNAASYQICTTAGTAGNGSEPSFSDTAGTTTADNTVTWTSLGVVGNFTGGQAPHARLFNAYATNWFVAGNTIYIGDNHAETQASNMNLQPSLTVSTVSAVLCHSHSGSYPPTSANLTTGASVSTTGGTQIQYIPSIGGGLYIRGVKLSSNAYLNLGTAGCFIYLDSCALEMTGSASYTLSLPSSGVASVILDNTTVKFGGTGQTITVGSCTLIWRNTAPLVASGSSVPSNFLNTGTSAFTAIFEACDLNVLTGNFNAWVSGAVANMLLQDCKINSSLTFTPPIAPGSTVQLVRCDSGATAYKSARYQYEGSETTETTVTRVGGSVDPAGQAQTRKIVDTANVQWLRPFKAEPYAIWNGVTGSNVTVTVCGTINSASLPNNDDIWLEVEYLGSSATPIGTIVTTTKSNVLAANAAVASDSSSWNGGGSGAGWSPFKLTVTLSSPQPAMVGYIIVRVRTAKASTTYYIDPMVTLS